MSHSTPFPTDLPQLDSDKRLLVFRNIVTYLKTQLESCGNDADMRKDLQTQIAKYEAKIREAYSLAQQINNQVRDQVLGIQQAHPVLGNPAQQQQHDDGAGSECSDGDSLMGDALDNADEQLGGIVPAAVPANNVTDFTEARADPSKDPRTKKLGPRWISDKDMSEIVTHSDMNPHGKGVAPYEVNATNRDKFMGSRQIDPTLSGLTEKRHFEVVQFLGKQLFGGPKQPEVIRKNDDGTFSRLVSTILNGRPPADAAKSLLNLLMGRAQGGKAQEAVNDCWAKSFVHATLPIYYVRNCGGLGDAPQTVDDFKEFNAKIDKILDNASRSKPEKYGWLNAQAERDKFKLFPRIGKGTKASVDKCGLRGQINGGIGLVVELDRTSSINPEWRTEDEYVVKLAFPQVIVALTNQSHFKSFMEHGLVLNDTYTLSTGLTLTKAQMTDAIKKKFTPFDIVAGKSSEPHMIRSGRKNASVFKITLHSAYPPWAWDMTKPYDASGFNAPRLRYARCIDEIDASRSENPVHKVNALTYQSRAVADKFGEALNPEAFEKQKKAQEGKRKEAARIAASEKKIDKAKKDLAKLQQGEEPEADQQTARADRLTARAANHDETQVQAQGAQWNGDEGGDESMSEEEEDAESTSEEDDDESESGSQGADDDRQAEMQARVESEEQRIMEMEEQLAEQEEVHNSFLEQEQEALVAAACNHVTGMQSSAAFNVGVTATIFGCLQLHDGGPTVLRVVKMPTPDAYNDLCYYSPEHSELRMLLNPEKRAGPGDIKIVESDIRSIGLRNVKSHRNEYIDTYIMQNGHCELDAAGAPKMEVWPNGKTYPAKPAEPLQPRSRGVSRCSYRISQEWLEANTQYPWVREMMQSFEKAAKVTPRRLQNMWERNSGLFTTLMKELQTQRLALRKVRRVAQALVISYETRNIKTKDILIGNLFTKLGKAPGAWVDGSEEPDGESEPMHQVSCYNFSYEGVKLIFDPNQLDREELQLLLNNPERLLSPLREYLRGDPRIKPKDLTDSALKRTYIDKIAGTDDRPGLADWVERHPLGAGVLDQWENECADLRRANPNAVLPPKPRGDLFFKDWQLPLYNELTRAVEGHYSLVTLNFAGCKQPRYVATFFTLLDALCATAVSNPRQQALSNLLFMRLAPPRHRHYEQSPQTMLPMPIVGLTKTIGGRAQRFMCHGHRSRIQVMCHSTDIFPQKKLGLAMSDAIQEGFRQAGFDDVNGNMDGWVRQVYVTTKEFTPLMQNALLSMEEWVRLLHTEQTAPQREGESDYAFEWRQNAAPMELAVSFIADYLTRCCGEVRRIRNEEGRAAVSADMPQTEYPHIVKWLVSHVNQCKNMKERFLRHSNQDKNEDAVRDELLQVTKDRLAAEFEDEDEEIRDVDEDAIRAAHPDADEEEITELVEEAEHARDEALKGLYDEIPMPQFSAHHAPGGNLEQRDLAEASLVGHELNVLVRDRDQIAEQYAVAFPAHPAALLSKAEKKKKKDDSERKKQELLHEMETAGIEPDGAGRFGFSKEQVKEYKKQKKAEEKRAAKRQREQGDGDGEPVRKSSRPRTAAPPDADQMREKFAGIYHSYPSKAKTTSGRAMPQFDETIFAQWDVVRLPGQYHPARVFDMNVSEQGDIIYDLEWLTNDDGSVVPEEASMHAEETGLDLEMSDWSYEERGIAGPSNS